MTAGKPSLLATSTPSLTFSLAVRHDGRHEATTPTPNSFCNRLSSSDCWMRNFSDLRPRRLGRAVDQFVRHGLDHQSRRNVSRCSYKAEGTDLGHFYGCWRHHDSSGDSPERRRPQKLQ